MNSVTPIASLTETLQGMLTDTQGHPKPHATINADNLDDIRFSSTPFTNVAKGLLGFVDKYRTLSRIPRPTMGVIHLHTFFDQATTLLAADLQRQGITLITSVDDAIPTITGDAALLEQVIINLVSNSTYALQATPQKQISLRAFPGDRHTILEVTDNGKGIPQRDQRNLHPILFHAQRRHGHRPKPIQQIMSSHGGTIRVQSVPGQGASFQLYFKKQF